MADIWRVDLDGGHDASVLDTVEVERAGRMRDGQARSRFLASRSWLRVILADYVDVEPVEIRYQVSSRGKPAVVNGGDLCFSHSRSAEVGLVAVCRGRAVGVDVERVRGDVDHLRVADRFFAAAEAEMLRSTPEDDQAAAFFELWVRKEAVVKASGAGLGDGIGHIDIRRDVVGDRWALATVDARPGFKAAVATEGSPLLRRVHDATAELVGATARSKPRAGRTAGR